MRYKNIVVAAFLFFMACRHAPFAVKDLSAEKKVIHQEKFKRLTDLDTAMKESLRVRYKKAGSPTFSLIKGYYHLPSTKPFGSVKIVEGYTYQTRVSYLELSSSKKPYDIEPIDADEALGLEEAFNSLLDIGVKIIELSMADSLKVAEAEKSMEHKTGAFKLDKVLAPSVDFLVSIDRADSINGPMLIGRVIKKDGTLQAFRIIKSGDTRLLGGLVISLFEDSINRLNL